MKALLILLRKAALFLGVSIVVYAATMYALYHVPVFGHPLLYKCGDYYQGKGGVSYQKFQELDTARHYDAVVIGSSHAYRGYDPRLFAARGFSVFNLGTSAQAPMNSYFVLSNYVSARNCGLVIFDLYENTMEHDALESTSDLTRNISSERAAMQLALAAKDPRAVNLMALRWLSRHEPATRADSTYRSGGFAERTDSLKREAHFEHGLPLRLDSTQVGYFRKCIAYCRERHIPLVLVTHYYPNASDHERHQLFHAFVEREIAGTGIHYVDLAYAGRVDDRDHFYDHNHLNAAGVELFNTQLLDSLATLRILPH